MHCVRRPQSATMFLVSTIRLVIGWHRIRVLKHDLLVCISSSLSHCSHEPCHWMIVDERLVRHVAEASMFKMSVLLCECSDSCAIFTL